MSRIEDVLAEIKETYRIYSDSWMQVDRLEATKIMEWKELGVVSSYYNDNLTLLGMRKTVIFGQMEVLSTVIACLENEDE